MVICSMFFYHFVYPGLKVKVFFEKEGAAEQNNVDFEIRNISTSAHLYRRLKKISCRTLINQFKSLLSSPQFSTTLCNTQQNLRRRYSIKKAALKNFKIFIGKHLCLSHLRLQHRCFPVNIAKFLKTPVLKSICKWLLL